jgi:FKBP-type peptidyl-prolyl cis-trans isomerase 2
MVQKGEFIQMHFTGKLRDGTIFDSTHPDISKQIGSKRAGPVTICVGEHMLIPGLDEALEGKNGKFSVTIAPDKAFGTKDPKLLKIIPTRQLLQQQIRPYPGLQLNVDGEYGIVRTVSPGRTVVDFNHPLASQEVTYDVEILGKIEDAKSQVKAIIDPIGLPYLDVEVEGTKATIKVPQMYPQPILTALDERIMKLTSIKTVSFEQGQPPAKPKAE